MRSGCWKRIKPMDRTARLRQQHYRSRRKEAGFHRIEVWIPADIMAELDRRGKREGDAYRPALALIALVRKALKLQERNWNSRTP